MTQAAAKTFSVMEQVGAPGMFPNSLPIVEVAGPLSTTVVLLEDKGRRVCMICSHVVCHTRFLYRRFQQSAAQAIGLRPREVFVFSSHNHSSTRLSREPVDAWWGDGKLSGVDLTRFGTTYCKMLERTLKQLPRLLRPVSIEWATGHECTIAYNRKGRRADGTTYLMREEDRLLVGRDFCGDIDTEAPLVCLRGENGEPVCFLVQYTAHPATAFHPEHPNVFGEYAQVACERLSACYSNGHDVPVAFLQGCSGDINSKGLLSGDIAQATRYGERLAEVYIKASRKLRSSERNDFAFARTAVDVPLKHLPSQKHLLRQEAELLDFIRRAKEGDEDTHSCIGLNFPKALTPLYRAALAQMPLEWTQWALKMHSANKARNVPRTIKMEISVLRIRARVMHDSPPAQRGTACARNVLRKPAGKLSLTRG